MAATTKKRAPTPEQLGLVEAAPPPPPPSTPTAPPAPAPTPEPVRQPAPTNRAPTPEDLGLVPVEPANDNAPTPEDLGIVDPNRPPPTPTPEADSSWNDWWNWVGEQANDAGETLEESGDWVWRHVKDTLGLKEPPEPWDQDTSRRAPRPDMTPSSGIVEEVVDTVVDWLVPDAAWEWATSERTRRSAAAGVDAAMVFTGDMLKGLTMLGRGVDNALLSVGVDVDYWDRTPEQREAEWRHTLEWLDKQNKEWGAQYQKDAIPRGERDWTDAVIEGVVSAPTVLAAYTVATVTLGPIAGFAALDATVAAGHGDDAEGIMWAALKGATMGKVLEWANVLSRPLRIPLLSGIGAGAAAAEGADTPDIIAQAIIMPALGAMPRSGPINARYLREYGVMPDIRDIGGHMRDLFLGGNEPTAKKEYESAGWKLREVRTKHRIENTDEKLKWWQKTEEARKPQAGDGPESANDRVTQVNSEHEAYLEDVARRQYDEELPHRQRYDHAERRWRRSQYPFFVSFFGGPSWMEGPYMRSLHMYERGVLGAYAKGAELVTRANEENDQRNAEGRARADELRKQAEEEPDPEKRKKLTHLADYVEDETRRVTYDRRNDAEEAAEFLLDMSEARASQARLDLVEVIASHNHVDGRRALQMATERDRVDAYRSGLRKVSRANRRARELLKMGDDFVARQKERLKRDGITEENPETADVYAKVMDSAEQVRDLYRETAAFELYSSQTQADIRISFTTAAHDASLQPIKGAFKKLIDWIKRILGFKPKEEPPQDPTMTSPEDAKKDGPDGWDKHPGEDKVRITSDFERAYRSVMEHSQKDPKLGGIQDEVDHVLNNITNDSDVLPAISYIAQQRGYKSPSRRGKRTGKLRKDAAKRLGMTEEEFLDTPYGRAFNDEEIEAVIMILDRAYERAQRAYMIWRKTGSNNAYMMYQAELYRFLMIWERLQGVAAESGRSLRMFRDINNRYGSPTRPMTDLQYKMIMAGDGAQAGRMVRAFNRSFFSGLWEYYVNALLSGPQTALVNIYSGMNMVFMNGIIRPTVAWAVGGVSYAADATVGAFVIRPLRRAYRQVIRAIGSRKANKSLDIKEREEASMPYGIDAAERHRGRIRLGEVGARARGLFEGIFFGAYRFARALFFGERQFGETTYDAMGVLPWYLGGPIIRLPGRILAAIDEFFKAMMYQSSLRGQAYRLAMAEYNYSSQSFKDLRGRRKRYTELVEHPTPDIRLKAEQEAKEATFQQDLDPMWEGVPGFVAATPILKIMVPFTRTLLNSLEYILSATPIGAFLFKRTRDALLGRRGTAEQHTAIAHILIGTGISAWVFAWALAGNVAPPYPKDEKGRTMAGVEQVPPGSVRIPYTNYYISLNRIDPIGGFISLGNAAANAYKIAFSRGDEKDMEKAWSALLSATFSMIADRSGFRGLLDFISAFEGRAGDYKSWERWASKLMANFAVPNVINSWARTVDPVLRHSETVLEYIMARIPGEREKLPPVRNAWGDQIVGYDSYGDNNVLDYIQPIYWGKRSDDPATRTLITLFKIYGWAPGTVPRTVQGRRLTPREYDDLQVRAGTYAYEGMKQLSESPLWKDCERLAASQRDLRTRIRHLEGRARTPEEKAELRRLRKQYTDQGEELRKKRYQAYQEAKRIFRNARARARREMTGSSDGRTPGTIPDFWKRPRENNDAANSGEVPEYLPDWLEEWMHADDDMTEWEAEEQREADTDDGQREPSPVE